MKKINLLPPAEQKLLYQEKIYGSVRTFLFWSFFMYVIFAIVLVGGKYYFQYTASNVGQEIEQQKAIISKQDNVSLKKEIDTINNIVVDYNSLNQNVTQWSQILKELSGLVPEDVYVTNFSANTKTGRMDIAGVGGSRNSVLVLRNNILNTPEFKDIDLPFENLQKSKNVEFHYTFYLATVKSLPEPLKADSSTNQKTDDTSK